MRTRKMDPKRKHAAFDQESPQHLIYLLKDGIVSKGGGDPTDKGKRINRRFEHKGAGEGAVYTELSKNLQAMQKGKKC